MTDSPTYIRKGAASQTTWLHAHSLDANLADVLCDSLLSVRLTPSMQSAMGMLLGAARSASGNDALHLPLAGLRARIAFRIPAIASIDRFLAMEVPKWIQDAGKNSDEMLCVGAGGLSDDIAESGIEDILLEEIENWVSNELSHFAQKYDAVNKLGNVRQILRPGQALCVTGGGRAFSNEAGQMVAPAPLIGQIADMLSGETLFDGLGPVYRLLEPVSDENSVDLLTLPQAYSSPDGKTRLWSACARLSIETVPYLSSPVLIARPIKVIWQSTVPRRPMGQKNASAIIFSPIFGGGDPADASEESHQSQHSALRISLPWDRTSRQWELPDEFGHLWSALIPRSPSPAKEIKSVDDLVQYGPVPAGGLWVGMRYNTRYGRRHVPSTMLEIDENRLWHRIQDCAGAFLGAPLEFQQISMPSRSEHAMDRFRPGDVFLVLAEHDEKLDNWQAAAKSFGFTPSLERIAGADDPEKAAQRSAVTPRMSDDKKKLYADQRKRNWSALLRHHPEQDSPTLVIISDGRYGAMVEGVAHAAFGDDLKVEHLSLPFGVHGSRRGLASEKGKPLERFKVRVDAWRETAEAVRKLCPAGAYVLICARSRYRDEDGRWYDDDLVNYSAGHHVFPSVAGANVHYLLPWDNDGVRERGSLAAEYQMADFVHRTHSAIMDLMLGHNGHLHDPKGHAAKHFADNGPRYVLALTQVASAASWKNKFANRVRAALRLDLDTGRMDCLMAYADSTGDVALTDWMPMRKALVWLASNLKLKDGRGYKEKNVLTAKFLEKVLAQAGKSKGKYLVMPHANKLRGAWRWLQNGAMTGSNITLGHAEHIEQTWPNLMYARVREKESPRVRVEVSHSYQQLDQHDVPTTTLVNDSYFTTQKRLLKISEEEQGGGVSFVGVMGYHTTVQIRRGSSGYRPTSRMIHVSKIKGSPKPNEIIIQGDTEPKVYKTFTKEEVQPETQDVNLSNSMEITVVNAFEGIAPDTVASFVMGLRKGFAQTSDWTSLPGPLFFERRIDDYMVGYTIEDVPDDPVEDDAPHDPDTEDAAYAISDGSQENGLENHPKGAESASVPSAVPDPAEVHNVAKSPGSPNGASILQRVGGASPSGKTMATSLKPDFSDAFVSAPSVLASLSGHYPEQEAAKGNFRVGSEDAENEWRDREWNINFSRAKDLADDRIVVDLPEFYTRKIFELGMHGLMSSPRVRGGIIKNIQRNDKINRNSKPYFGGNVVTIKQADLAGILWNRRSELFMPTLVDDYFVKKKRIAKTFCSASFREARKLWMMADTHAEKLPSQPMLQLPYLIQYMEEQGEGDLVARLILEPFMAGLVKQAELNLDIVKDSNLAQVREVRDYLNRAWMAVEILNKGGVARRDQANQDKNTRQPDTSTSNHADNPLEVMDSVMNSATENENSEYMQSPKPQVSAPATVTSEMSEEKPKDGPEYGVKDTPEAIVARWAELLAGTQSSVGELCIDSEGTLAQIRGIQSDIEEMTALVGRHQYLFKKAGRENELSCLLESLRLKIGENSLEEACVEIVVFHQAEGRPDPKTLVPADIDAGIKLCRDLDLVLDNLVSGVQEKTEIAQKLGSSHHNAFDELLDNMRGVGDRIKSLSSRAQKLSGALIDLEGPYRSPEGNDINSDKRASAPSKDDKDDSDMEVVTAIEPDQRSNAAIKTSSGNPPTSISPSNPRPQEDSYQKIIDDEKSTAREKDSAKGGARGDLKDDAPAEVSDQDVAPEETGSGDLSLEDMTSVRKNSEELGAELDDDYFEFDDDQEIALRNQIFEDSDRLVSLSVRLVINGRAADAVALAEVYAANRGAALAKTVLGNLPVTFFYALAFAEYSTLNRTTESEEIRFWFDHLIHAEIPDSSAAKIALAATMRHAVFNPYSTAQTYLDLLKDRFGSDTPLEVLRADIGDLKREAISLNPEHLRKAEAEGSQAWREELDEMISACRSWAEQEDVHRNISFPPARLAWKEMLSPKHTVGAILANIDADKNLRSQESKIEDAIAFLSQDTDDINKSLTANSNRKHRQTIQYTAKNQLEDNFSRTQEHLERLLDHIRRDPERIEKSQMIRITAKADRLKTLLQSASEHVSGLTAGDEIERTANYALLNSIDSLLGEYENEHKLGRASFSDYLEVQWLELPVIPNALIPASPDWSRCQSQVCNHLIEEIDILSTDVYDWHIENDRFFAAQLYLRKSGTAADIDGGGFEDVIDAQRENLDNRLEHALDQVNQASLLSIISDAEKSEFQGNIKYVALQKDGLPVIESGLVNLRVCLNPNAPTDPRILDFDHAHRVLADQVIGYLEQKLEEARDDFRRKLEDRALSVDEDLRPQLAEVQRILNAGGTTALITAQEMLTLLESGEGVPSHVEANHVLRGFLHDFLPQVEAHMKHAEDRDLVGHAIAHLEENDDAPLFGIFVVKADRDRVIKALRAWQCLFDCGQDDGKIKKTLGDAIRMTLGIKYRRIRAENTVFKLVAPELEDVASADVFVVPEFASDAKKGSLIAWMNPGVSTFEDAIRALNLKDPGFGLLHVVLTQDDRARIAKNVRRDSSTMIIVDDALALFAALNHGSPARTLMMVGQSFIRTSPYKASTPMHMETFYGRREDLRELAKFEAKLVYGGRRLGKSSLLARHKETRHSSENKRYCFNIDCQPFSGASYEKDTYATIRRNLADESVLKASVLPHTKSKLFGELREWLKEDDERKLEIILDEADKMIAADRKKDYPLIRELQVLHQDFRNRFRFILAGTHNAVRLDRSLNTPLGHLSKPICVRPFVKEDRLDGIRLVSQPMSALGFTFSDPRSDKKNAGAGSWLPFEILATASFFPAVIQIFCDCLLDHLYKKSDWIGLPPYLISAKDVRDVAESPSVRDRLKETFRHTFRLDTRYELIAAILAERYYDSEGADQAMTPAEIRDLCVFYAPSIFPSREQYVISSYLTELEELSIIVRNEQSHYMLRSPNIARYMGTHDEIIELLVSMNEQPPPEDVDEQQLRRSLPGVDRCFPLTIRQTAAISRGSDRVIAVVGSPASGIDELKHALESSFLEKEGVASKIKMPPSTSGSPLQKVSAMFPRRRSRNSAQKHFLEEIYCVGQEVPWGYDEITRLARQVKGHSSACLALIIGGPEHAKSLLKPNLPDEHDQVVNLSIESIAPWTSEALRLFAENEHSLERLRGRTPIRDEIIKGTGGLWPMVEDVARVVGEKGCTIDVQQAIDEHPLSAISLDDLLTRFGLNNTTKDFLLDFCTAGPDHLSREDVDQKMAEDKEMSSFGGARYFEWMGVMNVNDKGNYVVNPFLAERLLRETLS